METQKTKTPNYALDKLSDRVFGINQETIGEARKLAYNTYASVDRVKEIFEDGLLSIKPILAEVIVDIKNAIKDASMIEKIIKLDLEVMAIIESAQQNINHYYCNGYNQVQLCEEAELELEAVEKQIENYIDDFKIFWYKQIDKRIKTLEKEIGECMGDILIKVRKGLDKNIKPNKNDIHND